MCIIVDTNTFDTPTPKVVGFLLRHLLPPCGGLTQTPQAF